MPTHEPWCEKCTILLLPLYWQAEETANHLAATSRRATVARPGGPISDIDVVVARNLLADCNVAPRHQVAVVAFVGSPGVWIAAVVDVAVRRAPQNYLAVGIRTVVDGLAEVFAD